MNAILFFQGKCLMFPGNDNLFEHGPLFLSTEKAYKRYNQFQTLNKVFNKYVPNDLMNICWKFSIVLLILK